MAADRVQVNVSDVPEAIRDRFVAEARERDLSLTQLAIEIVSRCYSVRVEVSGQTLRKKANGEVPSAHPPWVMRFPLELAAALDRAAGGRRIAKGRLVVNCLAEHYGLPAQSPLNRSLGQPRDEGGRFARRG
jgi:hypothetical protein